MNDRIVKLALRDFDVLIPKWFVPGPGSTLLKGKIARPLTDREESFFRTISEYLQPGEMVAGFFDNDSAAATVDDAMIVTDRRLIAYSRGLARPIPYGPIVSLQGPKEKAHDQTERVPLVIAFADGTTASLLVPFGYIYVLMGFLKRPVLRSVNAAVGDT